MAPDEFWGHPFCVKFVSKIVGSSGMGGMSVFRISKLLILKNAHGFDPDPRLQFLHNIICR